jgi:hypothetical protein
MDRMVVDMKNETTFPFGAGEARATKTIDEKRDVPEAGAAAFSGFQ